MKSLYLMCMAFAMSLTQLSAQVSTCDLELLEIDWDNQTITLTLNDDLCSNSSTPSWVPTEDSVYVAQLYFGFNGTNCSVNASAGMFQPALGLNDTITYSFDNWTDVFDCFDNAFAYYQETCTVTVSVVGPNNSINLDLIGGNNYIGFNPIWNNCYGDIIDPDPESCDTIYVDVEIPVYIIDTLYITNTIYVNDTITLIEWVEVDCETGLPCIDLGFDETECSPWSIYISNAFTPDGDGFNDTWGPVFDPHCWEDVELHVYNSWGQLLWESYDKFNMIWNGFGADNGIYIYSFYARRSESPEIEVLNGHIVVVN